MADAEKQANDEMDPITEELVEDVTSLRAEDDIMNEGNDEASSGDDSSMTPGSAPTPKTDKDGRKMRWYIVHVYSGFEKKIALGIKEKAVQNGITDQIGDVVVPTQDVLEVRRGKKVSTEKKFFPGYILVQMVLTDESWHMVKNIDKVTDFLGQGGKPQRVPDREVETIFQQIEEGVSAAASGIIFEIGDSIKITDGPFESFTGVIEEVDEEREKVKVSVSIFGRATPVELDYTQVQKT